MESQVVGYVVVAMVPNTSRSGTEPREISRVFHSKAAAEEFARLAERTYRDGVWVREKMGYDNLS